MSLNLDCPACGAQVGKIVDDKEIYFYKGDKGQVTCKNCGSGNIHEFEKNTFIFTIILVVIIFTIIMIAS